jgi:NAD(P)-dependent dehydrogenase (short-subunit alcohol dehydrogenase family)
MPMLDGKVAVVTGAGSGMGEATALAFAREGAMVVAADVSGAQDATAKTGGDNVISCHADVTSEADVAAMLALAAERFGGLDILCNVAGIGLYAPVDEMPLETFEQVLAVNLVGVFLGMKHAIPLMRERGGGSIINWSSVGGLNASSRQTVAYSASKFGVVGVTKVAAVDYGKHNIRVNAICPGFIPTAILGADAMRLYPENRLEEKAALQRAGEPDEVAQVAVFLGSDRASYVSGAIIPVDGGWSARLA